MLNKVKYEVKICG